jgi:hypothetical protein
VRVRKMELDHFLGKHGVYMCLLTKTHLRSGHVFRLANYVCHRTDRLTEGGGTACNVGKRTGENPGGLPFALPAPNRSGSVCLPELRAPRLDDGGPERQARGLVFEANHDKGQAPA